MAARAKRRAAGGEATGKAAGEAVQESQAAGPGPTLRQRFTRLYLSADPRSLALGRIVLALILIADLLRRVPGIDLWYSNNGLLPNHTLLWRPPTQWMFSLFFMASWWDEAAVGFVLCGLVYLALLVGWRTRLMQVLAVICVISLHSRVTFLENGGDWTLGELAIWTAFLPLGRRFSVDAVRASLRRRRETTAAELADREAMRVNLAPVVSLAVFALLLQLADSYLFNCLQKGGPTWRTGTAVHYVTHQDRMVTWFGEWIRPHMTLGLSRAFSWASLATEAVLPVLLLSPVFQPRLRSLAVLAVVGLHTGFQLFINVGIFSWAMIGYAPYLLSAADWARLARLESTRRRRLTAYIDGDCGICFQLARVVARLDAFARVTLVAGAEAADPLPAGVTRALLQETLVVVDERRGRVYRNADAVAQILSALPVGFLWAWPLRIPGLRALANLAYGVFARRRRDVSVFFGLAACGIPARPGAAALPPPPEPEPAPLREALRARVPWLREAGVVAMLAVLLSETLFINDVVPRFLKHEQPLWIKQLVAYPRLIQAWSMFAADAPTTDETVAVDAVTVDGRHVDPYSEVAGRLPNPGHDSVPSRLDNNSFFFNYSARIPFKPEYFTAFEEWLLRYPERTGNPADRIVKFDAYIIEDDSPPIGQTQPHNIRSRVFLSFPRKP